MSNILVISRLRSIVIKSIQLAEDMSKCKCSEQDVQNGLASIQEQLNFANHDSKIKEDYK